MENLWWKKQGATAKHSRGDSKITIHRGNVDEEERILGEKDRYRTANRKKICFKKQEM